jgi:PAS domain S-box-containing protein
MSLKNLHILLLEDDELDVGIIKSHLQFLDDYHCRVTWVADKSSYINILESDCPDIILSDYKLPQYNGLDALNDLKSRNKVVPFIIVTGTLTEETAAETIKAGAWDYVVKERLFRLPLAIRGALQLMEEKAKAASIEARNRQLSMAVEQSPRQIIIANRQHQIEYINPRYIQTIGIIQDDVLGKDISILLPESYKEEFNKLIGKEKPDKIKWHTEIQSIRDDGSILWEDVSILPLRANGNEITHYIISREDITERKTMQQTLMEALEKASESDRLKEAFLHNLSHEIRTPLNAIVGFSEILAGGDEEDLTSVSEYATIIKRSSDQLLSIVSDVLTVASIQTGQETIVLKPVNISELFDYLKDMFLPDALHKNLKLLFNKNIANNQFCIMTDETKLKQILSNLLTNAIKFTHSGSIEVMCGIQENNVAFSVKDTGIGIPKESHHIIFERFRQADPSISVKYGGTGLGLSISKSFAQILGGTLRVNSEPSHGSTFTLTLPNQVQHDEKIRANSTLVVPDAAPHVILIVEDEIYNYELLKAILQNKNMTLLHAGNGSEAVKTCINNPKIDLVLMDIKMPVMDGITAFREIRKSKKQLPVIAVTAYALEQEKRELLRMGFDDYIVKPVSKEELYGKINNVFLTG